MYRLMKCLMPPRARDTQAPEHQQLPHTMDKNALSKGPHGGQDSPHESDLLKPSSLRMISGNEKSEQGPEDVSSNVDGAKDAVEGDSRGIWHVHVQAGRNSSSRNPTVHGVEATAGATSAQPSGATSSSLSSKHDISSPSFPTHFHLRTNSCTPSPDTIVVSSAQATCRHTTVETPPTPPQAGAQPRQQSGGSVASVAASAGGTRRRGRPSVSSDHRASKHPTQCSESSDSGSPPLPVGIAPEVQPDQVQEAGAAAEAKHIELAGELGLPLEHEAFSLWHLVDPLGSGAFSKVYLATALGSLRRDLPCTCVIKVVNLGASCKIRDDYKPILRSEGLALQRFRFPGFVQCFASWGSALPLGQQDVEPPSHLVLALEHLTGGMLLDRLKKGPLAEHHAAAAFHQILTCILYMHHSGYLHRDLKPDNVMLAYEWDPERDAHVPPPVKLIDLGMVLNYVEQPNETGLMGSPGYMSPEAIRGHRHTPQMDMYSLGVLLFVMLTGCKPIPSAICTKLSYDRLETADYPGIKMQQFRRLSAPARELVLALMARRPADRPCAMAALVHPWVHGHAQRWRASGVDLSELALPRSDLQDAVRRAPRVDELVARARAARPLPPAPGASSRGRLPAECNGGSRATTPTHATTPTRASTPPRAGTPRPAAAVRVSERGAAPAARSAGAIMAEMGGDVPEERRVGQENLLPRERHPSRSRQAVGSPADMPPSHVPTPPGFPARPPLARQGSAVQTSSQSGTLPAPAARQRRISAAGGASASATAIAAASVASLTAGHSTGLPGVDGPNRSTPLRRNISNALSDTIDNILDLIQQQSGTISACGPAATPCGSAITGPLTPQMHPGMWGSQYGGVARMRSRSGSLQMPAGDSLQLPGGGSSLALSSAIPHAPTEGAAAVSITPGSTTPVSPARGTAMSSMSGKAVPARSINRALSAVFQAAETVADADYSAAPSPTALPRVPGGIGKNSAMRPGASQHSRVPARPTKHRSCRSGRISGHGQSPPPRNALQHLQHLHHGRASREF